MFDSKDLSQKHFDRNETSRLNSLTMYLAILEVSVESDESNPEATPLHQPYLIRTAEFGVERKSLQCTDFFLSYCRGFKS